MYEKLLERKLKEVLNDLYNGTWDIDELEKIMKLIEENKLRLDEVVEIDFNEIYDVLWKAYNSNGYVPKNEKEQLILDEARGVIFGLLKIDRDGRYRLEDIVKVGKVKWSTSGSDEFTGHYTRDGWPKYRHHSAKENYKSVAMKAVYKDLEKQTGWPRGFPSEMYIDGPSFERMKITVTKSYSPTGIASDYMDDEMEGYVEYKAVYKIHINNLSHYVYEKIANELKEKFENKINQGLKSVIQQAIDYYELGYSQKEISEYLKRKIERIKKYF